MTRARVRRAALLHEKEPARPDGPVEVGPPKERLSGPPETWAPAYVCLRDTRFPWPWFNAAAKLVGKRHMWLETERLSLGMAGGRNEEGDSRGGIFSTEVVCHRAEWSQQDVQIDRVLAHEFLGNGHPPIDGRLLESLMEPLQGKKLGMYVPFLRDCETFVRGTLKACAEMQAAQIEAGPTARTESRPELRR